MNRQIVLPAGIATVMHCVVLLLELFCGRNNPGSQVPQSILFFPKSMNWILNSHHVWMIQTTDALLLNCNQNVRGSMGAICKSSIPAYVLEWVGQWSVTPRRITESLSVSSSFITLWSGLRTSEVVNTQSERKTSSSARYQRQTQSLNYKTHVHRACVTQRETQPFLSAFQSAQHNFFYPVLINWDALFSFSAWNLHFNDN